VPLPWKALTHGYCACCLLQALDLYVDRLRPGDFLTAGQYLRCADGRVFLRMQPDGNLVTCVVLGCRSCRCPGSLFTMHSLVQGEGRPIHRFRRDHLAK